MTVNPSNETRIRQLEGQVSRLSAVVEALRSQRSGGEIDQIIRPARTCLSDGSDSSGTSGGTYPTTGDAVPIVFLDARHSGLESTTQLSERATRQQAVAATLDGTLPPLGTEGVVIRYERQWFFVAHFQFDSSSECSGSGSSCFDCVRIPGVDLDSVPVSAAVDVDYVLGIKNGCLVKVALSECDPGSSV